MSIQNSNVTSGFIDLATYDEIEKYMYGGNPDDVTAYFVKRTVKTTWFTQVPVVLSRSAGSPGFGQEWSVNISRAGDYLLYAWLRVQIPQITPAVAAPNDRIRWTPNLMHNLCREISITFNDLAAERIDNFFLDFWAAFTVPAGKRNGYANMIGDIAPLTQGAPYVGGQATLPATTLNLPIPLFFARDSGVALPTAALPYNEMRINFQFRNWNELLIVDNPAGGGTSRPATAADIVGGAPVLGNTQVWANYAIVGNDERKRMACAPRNILMEQVQTSPLQIFAPAQNRVPSYDIRFSHAIKVLFFAARNKTCASQWSVYSTLSPVPQANQVNFFPPGNADPINDVTLIYENTQRLATMGADYFSLVNPYYHAPVIPTAIGYHAYSYALDFYNLDPTGSTNYGKLTNVSILPSASNAAVAAAATQSYEFVCLAVNNNIIRISGGALGFPIL